MAIKPILFNTEMVGEFGRKKELHQKNCKAATNE